MGEERRINIALNTPKYEVQNRYIIVYIGVVFHKTTNEMPLQIVVF